MLNFQDSLKPLVQNDNDQYSSPAELNLHYLQSINPGTTKILFNSRFSSINELDQCVGIWHSAGYQGPLFLIEMQPRQYQLIMLNQDSVNDFIKSLNSDFQMEIMYSKQVKGNDNFLFFRDNQENIYNFWFSFREELKELEKILKSLFPQKQLVTN